MLERRALVAGLVASSLLNACAATPSQQIASLSASSGAVEARVRESRRFETGDRDLMLQSALGALQDLGFTIDESDGQTGILVGSKLTGAEIRAQVTIRSIADREESIVRATFQRIVNRPGAMLAVGETLDDPLLYQSFFERVAHSAFLTAHQI